MTEKERIARSTDAIADAQDDQKNTLENIEECFEDYIRAVNEIKTIQKRFAIAMFWVSFTTSFVVGLTLIAKNYGKIRKLFRR